MASIKKETLLIIDDEDPVRQSISYALKNLPFEMVQADNGREGLSRFRDLAPILTLIDLKMPILDGISFLREVQIKPSDPQAIIVLTGHGSNDEIQEIFDLGASFLVRKPFNIFELRGLLLNAIQTKQELRTLQNRIKELEEKTSA